MRNTHELPTHLLKRTKGFTLIEVLVALAVMAFMAVGLTQITGTSSKASRSIANKTQRVWRDESVTLGYVEALSLGGNPQVPKGLEVQFANSAALNEKEVEKLKGAGYQLRNVTVKSKETGETLWQGSLLGIANQ